MGKQQQEVGNQSTAIQVEGDLHIGPNYEEIKQIFLDLFDLNFPQIQQAAKETAAQRINEFLAELRKSFENNKESIDPRKFSDPGIQYEMQQMAIDVARRGNKSNIELLSELLCIITSSDCPDLIELIAGETRKILPMLSKKHLEYLSFLILFYEAILPVANLEQVNENLNETLNYLKGLSEITPGDLSYLSSNSCINQRSIRLIRVVPKIVTSIKEYENISLPELKSITHDKGLLNIEKLIVLSEQLGIGTYYPSAFGRLIGWLNLGKYSEVDPRQLF